MNDLKTGQVLWLKIRFNNSGLISNAVHPYLIASIDNEYNTIEIIQMDSLKGKEWKAMFKSNVTILNTDPVEEVIQVSSYAQMDNTFTVENYDGLVKYRKTAALLSQKKLENLLKRYNLYHNTHTIDENKIVFLSSEEIENLNHN